MWKGHPVATGVSIARNKGPAHEAGDESSTQNTEALAVADYRY
jgi:hypothetical protein